MKNIDTKEHVFVEDLVRPEISLAKEFNDGIPRDIVDLNKFIKSPNWEKLINRLSGYRCIVDALNQTRAAIKCFFAVPKAERREISAIALWSYAVIQYCKCYQSNEGWTVTLEPSGTLKNESDTLRDGHKWFMNERHSFVAHGGKTLAQKSFVFVGCRKESPNQIDGILGTDSVAVVPSDASMAELDNLAEISVKYAQNKISEIYRVVFQKLLDEKYVLSPELIDGFNLKK